MDRRKTILVIDDDPAITRLLCCALAEEYEVQVASSGEEGLRWAAAACPQLVLLDLNLPRLGGLAVLRRLHDTSRRLPIVIMTAYGKIESAVQAMRLGAVDYLEKPIGMDKLKRQMQEWCAMQDANPAESPACHKIVGESPQILGVWHLIKKFALSDMTILLEGESGTGKELFAQAIHELSKRRHGPFVPLDCASLPNSIFESEIFGYERGAFTGATQNKVGRLAWANEGTLFLDEVANIPLDSQGKLLRVLQEREFSPLGAHRPQRVALDVRIVGASNRLLMEMVHDRRFREDLYSRLSAVSIHIPPLRDRTGDIELLTAHFLHSDAEQYGKPCPALAPETLVVLSRYPWPGNVRELENVIKSAALLAKDLILPTHLPLHLQTASSHPRREVDDRTRLHLEVGVELADQIDLKAFRASAADAAEKELITCVTQGDRFKQFELAAFLSIDPKTLRSKLKRYGLSQEEQVHGGKDPGSRRSG